MHREKREPHGSLFFVYLPAVQAKPHDAYSFCIHCLGCICHNINYIKLFHVSLPLKSICDKIYPHYQIQYKICYTQYVNISKTLTLH